MDISRRRSSRFLRGPLALVVIAVALGVLILSACSGGSEDGTPAATRTQIGTTPTIEASASSTATAAPSTTATPDASERWGAVTIEIATGEVTTLYEGVAPIWHAVRQSTGAWPAARDGAIWLSLNLGESVRFGLDGAVLERIEGWGVTTSEDGTTRAYFVGDEAALSLVVERDGERHEARGERFSSLAISPDGTRVAWLDEDAAGANAVTVMDARTGDVDVIANVPLCSCDGFHYLEWSPASDVLAYANPAHGTPELGIYLHPMKDGADPVLLPGVTFVVDGWLEVDGEAFLLVLDGDSPTLYPAAYDPEDEDSEAEPVVLDVRTATDAIEVGTLQGLVLVTTGTGPARSTLIVDPVSGERLRELRGFADAVLTPSGIATATIARNDLACTGIEIEHPALKETLDCEADYVRWSPDGRYLALIPQSESAPVEILDIVAGTRREVPHAGPRDTVPTWSDDGRYLVWLWAPPH